MQLGDIAERIGAVVEGDPALEIDGLETLERAGPGQLSFLANPRYSGHLATCRASAIILGEGVEAPSGCDVLRCGDPYVGFALALRLFHRPCAMPEGIDPRAVVDPTATIDRDARIAAGVHIGAGVRVGPRATLHPGVVIYPDTVIGADFTAHANVVVRERVQIGDRVTLFSGVVVGSDGFGYVPLPGGGIAKLPQIGTVEIGNDVEVGANSTIDRATVGVTRIENGAKIDNLVMIAHGCRIGEDTMIAAQAGLAGSTDVGSRVQIGGQVGAAGHLRIGDGARIAAQSGVPSDVDPQATISGYPAVDAAIWRRMVAALPRVPELLRRVRRLERPR